MQSKSGNEKLLCYYALGGHISALKLLLQHGVDPNVKVTGSTLAGCELAKLCCPVILYVGHYSLERRMAQRWVCYVSLCKWDKGIVLIMTVKQC